MVNSMSNTDDRKIHFGRKVCFVEKEESVMLNSANDDRITNTIVLRRIVPRKVDPYKVFIRVDFEKKSKKDYYRQMNKMLGEG